MAPDDNREDTPGFPADYAARIEAIIKTPLDENGEISFSAIPGSLAEAHQELWHLRHAGQDLRELKKEVREQLKQLRSTPGPDQETGIAEMKHVISIIDALVTQLGEVAKNIEVAVRDGRIPEKPHE